MSITTAGVFVRPSVCLSVCLSVCYHVHGYVSPDCSSVKCSIAECQAASRVFSATAVLVCCVADALEVEREKCKVIATDLDLTFTELAGY